MIRYEKETIDIYGEDEVEEITNLQIMVDWLEQKSAFKEYENQKLRKENNILRRILKKIT